MKMKDLFLVSAWIERYNLVFITYCILINNVLFYLGSEVDSFEIQNEICLSKSALCNVELPEVSDIED
jgi:hypothetical protein